MDVSELVVGVVVIVTGVMTIRLRRGFARALRRRKADDARSSLLNRERAERESQIYATPEGLRLSELQAVVTGAALLVVGLVVVIQALT